MIHKQSIILSDEFFKNALATANIVAMLPVVKVVNTEENVELILEREFCDIHHVLDFLLSLKNENFENTIKAYIDAVSNVKMMPVFNSITKDQYENCVMFCVEQSLYGWLSNYLNNCHTGLYDIILNINRDNDKGMVYCVLHHNIIETLKEEIVFECVKGTKDAKKYVNKRMSSLIKEAAKQGVCLSEIANNK